jgi:hypothetical protein
MRVSKHSCCERSSLHAFRASGSKTIAIPCAPRRHGFSLGHYVHFLRVDTILFLIKSIPLRVYQTCTQQWCSLPFLHPISVFNIVNKRTQLAEWESRRVTFNPYFSYLNSCHLIGIRRQATSVGLAEFKAEVAHPGLCGLIQLLNGVKKDDRTPAFFQ